MSHFMRLICTLWRVLVPKLGLLSGIAKERPSLAGRFLPAARSFRCSAVLLLPWLTHTAEQVEYSAS